MRTIAVALVLVGCAPATPMRCNPSTFAGFECDGAALSRSAIEAVCATSAVCQLDGTVLCVDNSPSGGAPYQLRCANGQPSR